MPTDPRDWFLSREERGNLATSIHAGRASDDATSADTGSAAPDAEGDTGRDAAP
ncbi:hypothetical protein [Curtobacterium sp. 314Chir4.1]|uniref:hypothetical protein n=1 Tax=Curtobacterium sp. 314Chir4.1 TaxID=1279028 RepID=UPI0020D220A9|nr:hypothetical protein [Curtobacterium sp. 314Chir4.1]